MSSSTEIKSINPRPDDAPSLSYCQSLSTLLQNIRNHFLALGYSIPNSALYLNSGDEFFAHVKIISTRLSQGHGWEKDVFGLLCFFSTVLLCSNQRVTINYIDSYYEDRQTVLAPSSSKLVNGLLYVEAGLSAVWKTVITSSSLYALTSSTLRFGPIGGGIVAMATLPGNLASQFADFFSLHGKKQNAESGTTYVLPPRCITKRCSPSSQPKLYSFLGSLSYALSQLGLYFNSPDAFLLHLHQLNNDWGSDERLSNCSSPEKTTLFILCLIGSGALFVSNMQTFYNLIYKKLTPSTQQIENTEESKGMLTIKGISTVYKSVVNISSLFALLAGIKNFSLTGAGLTIALPFVGQCIANLAKFSYKTLGSTSTEQTTSHKKDIETGSEDEKYLPLPAPTKDTSKQQQRSKQSLPEYIWNRLFCCKRRKPSTQENLLPHNGHSSS